MSQSLNKLTAQDLKFIRQTFALADLMRGLTSPDPYVGAVLVKKGKVLSFGYHGPVTTAHAEAWAIDKAGKAAKGATLYVNLEPCCHFGNNPPCTDLIIKAGIKKVVAAIKDLNPLVNGKGFEKLKNAGVKVVEPVLEDEAKKLNEIFFKHITTGLPFVILKTAMTLDGKIATRTGDSFWISGTAARQFTMRLRSYVDAIMVGIGTVLRDDPHLNVRQISPFKKDSGLLMKNPYKIILDSDLRIPLKSKVLSLDPGKAIIAVKKRANKNKIKALVKLGAEVITVSQKDGLLNLGELMRRLGENKITSILIEGGGRVSASALSSQIVDKVVFTISPKIVGGKDALTPVEGFGIEKIKQAIKIRDFKMQMLGLDAVVEGYIEK